MGISLEVMPIILLALLVTCELSDIFDGRVARKQGEVTELGKILDPMADSIVRISIFFSFTHGLVKLPIPLVLVFLFRDIIISTLRTLCALHGTALAARFSGKLKAIIQAIAIIIITCLILPYAHGWIALQTLRDISFWVVSFAALYSAISGFEYLWAYRKYLSLALKK